MYPDMTIWNQKTIFKHSGAAKVTGFEYLDALGLSKVAENYPRPAQGGHEDLDDGGIHVNGQIPHVAPDFFGFRIPALDPCSSTFQSKPNKALSPASRTSPPQGGVGSYVWGIHKEPVCAGLIVGHARNRLGKKRVIKPSHTKSEDDGHCRVKRSG